MKIFKNFKELYDFRTNLPETGWIYIKLDDFQDLKKSNYYIIEKGEITPDDYIETEDDVIPKKLYDISKSMSGLVENHIFQAIYDNMKGTKKTFSLDEKIEALYHYVEEDTFLY